mmetsp:Transcript_48699/g.139237  ORF Transcript_48699/g.139237 Transcript_48699/m.139237 type:complete len:267 (-) Transcript_48699:1944-2744(-)
MQDSSATSTKSSVFVFMRAQTTSARANRTDCLVAVVLSSFSSSSESSSGAGAPRLRLAVGSAASSLAHCMPLRNCRMITDRFLTPSLGRTPFPAFLITPATPTALACRTESAASSRALPWGIWVMEPTIVSRNLLTSSWSVLLSARPWSTALRAQSANSSQVLKALDLRSSESWSSSRGRSVWQLAGMNSVNSSSSASTRVLTSCRDSFISSSTVVLMPRTLPSTTVRLMSCSSSSSSSSSGMSAGSTSVGRCLRTSKITGRSAGT